MNVLDFIRSVPIFQTLEEGEDLILKEYIEQKIYQENQAVFREKDPGDAVYIVATGAVRIVKMIDKKNQLNLAAILPGDFFGEMALLDGQPRSAAAVAARRSVLLRVTNESFMALMREYPYIALKIISQIACHLAVRLRGANRKISELENFRILRSS